MMPKEIELVRLRPTTLHSKEPTCFLCRGEINKHEEISLRSAERAFVAARSCRVGSADRSAVVPSSVHSSRPLQRCCPPPASPPRHSPPPLPPRHSPPPPPPATPRHPAPATPPHQSPFRVEGMLSVVWGGNTTPRSRERARRQQPVNLVNPVARAPKTASCTWTSASRGAVDPVARAFKEGDWVRMEHLGEPPARGRQVNDLLRVACRALPIVKLE